MLQREIAISRRSAAHCREYRQAAGADSEKRRSRRPRPLPSRGTRNQLSVSKKQDFVRRTVSRVLVGAKIMEAMVDVLIISALIPDYWPLLAGLTMAAVLALV